MGVVRFATAAGYVAAVRRAQQRCCEQRSGVVLQVLRHFAGGVVTACQRVPDELSHPALPNPTLIVAQNPSLVISASPFTRHTGLLPRTIATNSERTAALSPHPRLPQAPCAFLASPVPTLGAGAFRGGQTTPGLHGSKAGTAAGGGAGLPWDNLGAPQQHGDARGRLDLGHDLATLAGGKERSAAGAEITPLQVVPSITFDQVG